ncbi:MAG: hypothetical protein H7A38_00365 [Chlamydiales bacterium]|nr:hypothetical protein [Chlamydiales bacterium]
MSLLPVSPIAPAPALESLKAVFPSYHDHLGLFERIKHCAQRIEHHAGEIYRMDGSETLSKSFYVTSREFYIVQAKAGSGTFSSAFFVVQVLLERGETRNMLIKVARKPFDSEKEKLALLSPASKLSENIDHFRGSYKIHGKEEYVALFNASSCDFCHINYSKMALPVTFIIRQLISVGEGVASFHRANLILRDIKGANLLANWEEISGSEPEVRPGKVTDFGLVISLAPEGTKHSTTCTPTYAAPYIWENIVCQRRRIIQGKSPHEGGFQGKASDLFGLGRTIQFDLIPQILLQVAKRNAFPDIEPYVEMFLRPQTLKGRYSDMQLLAYERVNPGYVFHTGMDREKNDHLWVFKTEQEMYEKTLGAIRLIEPFLSKDEITKLKELAQLARDLQVTQKDRLLALLGVDKENEGDLLIQAFIKRLQAIYNITLLPLASLEFSDKRENVTTASASHQTTLRSKRMRESNVHNSVEQVSDHKLDGNKLN